MTINVEVILANKVIHEHRLEPWVVPMKGDIFGLRGHTYRVVNREWPSFAMETNPFVRLYVNQVS